MNLQNDNPLYYVFGLFVKDNLLAQDMIQKIRDAPSPVLVTNTVLRSDPLTLQPSQSNIATIDEIAMLKENQILAGRRYHRLLRETFDNIAPGDCYPELPNQERLLVIEGVHSMLSNPVREMRITMAANESFSPEDVLPEMVRTQYEIIVSGPSVPRSELTQAIRRLTG